MNLLIIGAGKGSWQIRGHQLGAVLGARVTSQPGANDWRWASVVMIVKRAAIAFAPIARDYGVPIVWDALDFWGQPSENGLDEILATDRLARALEHIRPRLVLGATEAMAQAAGGVCLPHHWRPTLAPRAVTDASALVVAYEGSAAYLDNWQAPIEAACRRRGWTFVVNPADLSTADIVVALRGGPWDGWMCRAWKSGVKLVNAMRAGRPVITQDSAAWRELLPVGALVESSRDLDHAFDLCASERLRRSAAESLAAEQYSVERMAEALRKAVSDVV